jgi:hypothetical protein
MNDRERLRRILDLSDRLGRLRSRVSTAAGVASRDLRDEVRSIAGSVVTIGLPGTLGDIAKRHRLEPHQILIVLMLLSRRLEPGSGSLCGREILSTLFPSAFDMLAGVRLLVPDSALLVSGAVQAVPPGGPDVLDTEFELSDAAFRAVERDVNPPAGGALGEVVPYRNHFEHLAEIGRLTALLLRRSGVLFELDAYGSRAYDEPESVTQIERSARALRARIAERLICTPDAVQFPLCRLAARMRLSDAEQEILVVLLLQESYYGNAGLEAVECVKMVSCDSEQLLRNRRLLGPEGRLRREGLVQLDEAVNEKELTGGLSLPRWVSAYLLGEDIGEERPIGPDTRLDFHEYLKRLDDSEQFFRDLDA